MRIPLGVLPIVCVASLILALRRWAAAVVRANPSEQAIVAFAGFFWIVVTAACFAWMGLSIREDAIEQRNGAATVAACGGIIGSFLLYLGASLGEGPSYESNAFSIGLAAPSWFATWAVLNWLGNSSVSVTEERDSASGWRLAGYLTATGIIFGRAVAGDWTGMEGAVRDFFRDGWPGFALALPAVWVERMFRPTLQLPAPAVWFYGIVPAGIYVAIAVGVCIRLGPW